MQEDNKKEQLKKEIENKEQHLLREFAKIEESTFNSINTLQKQGEQLNKIKKDVDIINENLSISEKLVKSMKGFASFMFINKNKIENNIEENNDKRNNKEIEKKEQKKSWSFFSKKKSKKENIENIENNILSPLDIMSNHLVKIKNNVNNQKDIIKQHNEILEKISENTDNANDRIIKINKNIKKII